MTEYINISHQPGADGDYYGPPGDQGLLYKWMRILAGGGTSEFSSIKMRGPLILSNGAPVGTQKYTFALSGNLEAYSFTGVLDTEPITRLGGNSGTNIRGDLSAPTSNPDAVGAKNNGTLIGKGNLNFNAVLRRVSGSGLVTIVVTVNGVEQNYFYPTVFITGAGNEEFTVSGTCPFAPWPANSEVLVFVRTAATVDFTIPFVSIDVQEV